jgi:hypothetical protein
MAVESPYTRIIGLESDHVRDILLNEERITSSWVGACATASSSRDPIVEELWLDIEPDLWHLGEDLEVVAVEVPAYGQLLKWSIKKDAYIG